MNLAHRPRRTFRAIEKIEPPQGVHIRPGCNASEEEDG